MLQDEEPEAQKGSELGQGHTAFEDSHSGVLKSQVQVDPCNKYQQTRIDLLL